MFSISAALRFFIQRKFGELPQAFADITYDGRSFSIIAPLSKVAARKRRSSKLFALLRYKGFQVTSVSEMNYLSASGNPPSSV